MFKRRSSNDSTPPKGGGRHRKTDALPVAKGKHARRGGLTDPPMADPSPPLDPCASGHDLGDPSYPGDGTAVMTCKNCTHTERYVV